MSRPSLVWVVTDQGVNHRAILAYVRAMCAQHLSSHPVLKHIYVDRLQLRIRKLSFVRETIRAHQRRERHPRTDDAVLVFRNSEARDDASLRRELQGFAALLEALRDTFPNTGGVLFNPMSEGAFLLFDEAVEWLQQDMSAADRSTLEDFRDQRRRGEAVNKDWLDALLGLSDGRSKRALDVDMADLLFGIGTTLPACEAQIFEQVSNALVEVLRGAGLG